MERNFEFLGNERAYGIKDLAYRLTDFVRVTYPYEFDHDHFYDVLDETVEMLLNKDDALINELAEMLNEAEDDEDETLVNIILEYLNEVKKVYADYSPYTFDDLYELADGSAFGDPRLDAKDNARWCMAEIIKEDTGVDVEECECPEDEIFDYLETHDVFFDKDGHDLLD